MTAILLVAASMVLGGCLPDRYVCASDADCGSGGRCEAGPERVCSFADPTCPSGRRIGEHGGELAETCTQAYPLQNACIAGTPPPTAGDTCAAKVCTALPACCTETWSEQCVRTADLVCPEASCGTWIASAADDGVHLLRWDSAANAFVQRARFPGSNPDRLAWIYAGGDRPDLAIGTHETVAVYGVDESGGSWQLTERQRWTHAPGATVTDITALDLDGDRTVELGLAYAGASPHVVRVGPSGEPTSLFTNAGTRDTPIQSIAWADYTDDGVPDLAMGTGADYRTAIGTPATEMMPAIYNLDVFGMGGTGGFPSVGWGDVDGDHVLDLVGVGIAVAVHTGSRLRVSAAPTFTARGTPGPRRSVFAIGDMDGDGRVELVLANSEPDGSGLNGALATAKWQEDSDVPYQKTDLGAPSVPPLSQIAVADIDGDQRLDVIGSSGRGLLWLRNITPNGCATAPCGPITFASPQIITAAGTGTAFAITGW